MTQHPEILQGAERRYHIESEVATTPYGIVYRAYSRRPVGKKILRRYYAVLQPTDSQDVDINRFKAEMHNAIGMADKPLHVEELIKEDGQRYYIVDRGRKRHITPKGKRRLHQFYIVVLLAILIIVLMVVRCSMTPTADPVVLPDDQSMEQVETVE